MFEKMASTILNQLLGKYMENVNSKQLKLSVWSGKVVFKELRLRKDIFQRHDLPFQVVKSELSELEVSFPWTALRSKSVTISCSNIFLSIEVEATNEQTLERRLENVQEKLLLLTVNGDKEEGDGLVGVISQNVVFSAKRIFVNVVGGGTNFYVEIGEIRSYPVDTSGAQTFLKTSVLRRKVDVNGVVVNTKLFVLPSISITINKHSYFTEIDSVKIVSEEDSILSLSSLLRAFQRSKTIHGKNTLWERLYDSYCLKIRKITWRSIEEKLLQKKRYTYLYKKKLKDTFSVSELEELDVLEGRLTELDLLWYRCCVVQERLKEGANKEVAKKVIFENEDEITMTGVSEITEPLDVPNLYTRVYGGYGFCDFSFEIKRLDVVVSTENGTLNVEATKCVSNTIGSITVGELKCAFSKGKELLWNLDASGTICLANIVGLKLSKPRMVVARDRLVDLRRELECLLQLFNPIADAMSEPHGALNNHIIGVDSQNCYEFEVKDASIETKENDSLLSLGVFSFSNRDKVIGLKIENLFSKGVKIQNVHTKLSNAKKEVSISSFFVDRSYRNIEEIVELFGLKEKLSPFREVSIEAKVDSLLLMNGNIIEKEINRNGLEKRYLYVKDGESILLRIELCLANNEVTRFLIQVEETSMLECARRIGVFIKKMTQGSEQENLFRQNSTRVSGREAELSRRESFYRNSEGIRRRQSSEYAIECIPFINKIEFMYMVYDVEYLSIALEELIIRNAGVLVNRMCCFRKGKRIAEVEKFFMNIAESCYSIESIVARIGEREFFKTLRRFKNVYKEIRNSFCVQESSEPSCVRLTVDAFSLAFKSGASSYAFSVEALSISDNATLALLDLKENDTSLLSVRNVSQDNVTKVESLSLRFDRRAYRDLIKLATRLLKEMDVNVTAAETNGRSESSNCFLATNLSLEYENEVCTIHSVLVQQDEVLVLEIKNKENTLLDKINITKNAVTLGKGSINVDTRLALDVVSVYSELLRAFPALGEPSTAVMTYNVEELSLKLLKINLSFTQLSIAELRGRLSISCQKLDSSLLKKPLSLSSTYVVANDEEKAYLEIEHVEVRLTKRQLKRILNFANNRVVAELIALLSEYESTTILNILLKVESLSVRIGKRRKEAFVNILLKDVIASLSQEVNVYSQLSLELLNYETFCYERVLDDVRFGVYLSKNTVVCVEDPVTLKLTKNAIETLLNTENELKPVLVRNETNHGYVVVHGKSSFALKPFEEQRLDKIYLNKQLKITKEDSTSVFLDLQGRFDKKIAGLRVYSYEEKKNKVVCVSHKRVLKNETPYSFTVVLGEEIKECKGNTVIPISSAQYEKFAFKEEKRERHIRKSMEVRIDDTATVLFTKKENLFGEKDSGAVVVHSPILLKNDTPFKIAVNLKGSVSLSKFVESYETLDYYGSNKETVSLRVSVDGFVGETVTLRRRKDVVRILMKQQNLQSGITLLTELVEERMVCSLYFSHVICSYVPRLISFKENSRNAKISGPTIKGLTDRRTKRKSDTEESSTVASSSKEDLLPVCTYASLSTPCISMKTAESGWSAYIDTRLISSSSNVVLCGREKLNTCVTVRKGSGSLDNALVIYIDSAYVLTNGTSYPLTLELENSRCVLSPKQTVSIHFVRDEVTLAINERRRVLSLLEEQTFRIGGRLFRNTVTLLSGRTCITILRTRNSMYGIKNELPLMLCVKDDDENSVIVPPNKLKDLFWANLLGKKIMLSIAGAESTLNFNLGSSTQFEIAMENETKTVYCDVVRVSNRIILKTSFSVINDLGDALKTLIVQMKEVSLSIINKNEVLYSRIEGLKFINVDHRNGSRLALTVESVSSDNQLYSAVHPKLLRTHGVMSAHASWIKREVPTVIEAGLELPHLDVRIESELVEELLMLLDVRTSSSYRQEIVPSVIITDSEMKVENVRTEEKRAMLGRSSPNSEEGFVVNQLEISEVNCLLSFIHSGRGTSTVFNFLLSTFASVTELPIELKKLRLSNLFTNPVQLLKYLTSEYQWQLYVQLYKVFGSLNALGNPCGIVSRLSTGVADLITEPYNAVSEKRSVIMGIASGGRSFVCNTIYGVADTLSKLSETLGTCATQLTCDDTFVERRRRRRGVKSESFSSAIAEGSTSLIGGTLSGIVGLIGMPIQGMKSGVAGFCTGMGRGVAGVVAKPIVGLTDLSVRLNERVKSIALPETYHRLRMPLVIHCDGIVCEYDEGQTQGKLLYTRLVGNDRGEYLLCRVQELCLLILTTTYLLIARERHVHKEYLLCKCKCSFDSKVLSVLTKEGVYLMENVSERIFSLLEVEE